MYGRRTGARLHRAVGGKVEEEPEGWLTKGLAGYLRRPAGYVRWPAGHLGGGLSAALSQARPRLGKFWLTLGAFSGSFGVRFLIRKKRELK